MNTIIIEDEPKQLEMIQNIIKEKLPGIRILTTSDSVHGGISAIKQYQPDLIITDVMLRGGTAFDMLDQLPELDSEIIFTTSYEQYAIRAFRLSAVDYLLKPLAAEELIAAVDKVREKRKINDVSNHLKLLISNFRSQHVDEIKIALPTQKGYSFIKPNDIVHCQSDNTYTTFYLIGGDKLLVSKTLKSCEQMLEPYTFCRVHNSSLINLKYIEEYERGEGGIVKLTGGFDIPISRRRKDHFLQLFKSQLP